MIRTTIFSLLLVVGALIAPTHSAQAAPAGAASDIEVFTATSATLEDLLHYLEDLAGDGFAPLTAPYQAKEKESGRTVWAIDGWYLSDRYMQYVSSELDKKQRGEVESTPVYGKTPEQFAASLEKAVKAGYAPMLVLRKHFEGKGLFWVTIAVRPTARQTKPAGPRLRR